MNQNLTSSDDMVEKYTILRNAGNDDHILDRLNDPDRDGRCNISEQIGPYHHINMLIRLLIYCYTGKIINGEEATLRSAATNLI